MRDFEAAHQMGLQTMGTPNPQQGAVAHPHCFGQAARAPVRRRCGQRLCGAPHDFRGIDLGRAPATGQICLDGRPPPLCVALSPARPGLARSRAPRRWLGLPGLPPPATQSARAAPAARCSCPSTPPEVPSGWRPRTWGRLQSPPLLNSITAVGHLCRTSFTATTASRWPLRVSGSTGKAGSAAR